MADDRLLVIGLDLDPNIVHLVAQLRAMGIRPGIANLRELVTAGSWSFLPEENKATLVTPRQVIDMTGLESVFWRPIDLTPHISEYAMRCRWISLTAGLSNWLFDRSRVPLVVNPMGSHKHNRSKPLHAGFLQALGMNIPSCITSADPAELSEFIAGGPAVVKSVTSTGTSVRQIHQSDLIGRSRRDGSLHLQRRVMGLDIRAFVIDEAVVSVGILSSDVDYHMRSLAYADIHRVDLPDALKRQLVGAAKLQNLPFTGWDLKLDSEGVYWCLECNPMPSFVAFDHRTRGRVTAELIHLLSAPVRLPRLSNSQPGRPKSPVLGE
jgi:hypothetical protein